MDGGMKEKNQLKKYRSVSLKRKIGKGPKISVINLLKQFRNIKSKSERDTSNARNKDLYNKINNEIKSFEIQEPEGAKLWCKAHWREDGETNSRYFCSLEKKQVNGFLSDPFHT